MRFLALAAAVALTPLALPPSVASATPLGLFSNVLVFGDSLSDPGNALGGFGIPGVYPNAQFTNGDTYATQLGADFASGRNFAFGGATAVSNGGSPDFAEQTQAYLDVAPALAPSLGPNPLAIAWFGGNDLRAAADNPASAPAIIVESVASIVANVGTLIASGINNVLVFGLPSLGNLPSVVDDPLDSFLAEQASIGFNSALVGGLGLLAPTGANIQYFDTFSLFEDILANSGPLGFAVTEEPCVVFNPDNSVASSCAFPDPTVADTYIFYDDLHPSEAVHTLIADAVRAQLAPVPLPASALLLLAALGGLVLVRRRIAA